MLRIEGFKEKGKNRGGKKMSVMQYSSNCQQCGGIMLVEADTKQTYNIGHCFRCGTIQGNRVLFEKDSPYQVALDKNGDWTYETIFEKGYGAYLIQSKDGFGSFGTFQAPLTEKEKKEFEIIFNDKDTNRLASFVTRYTEENGIELIFGSKENEHLLNHKKLSDKVEV